jgi:hypothetical protein
MMMNQRVKQCDSADSSTTRTIEDILAAGDVGGPGKIRSIFFPV